MLIMITNNYVISLWISPDHTLLEHRDLKVFSTITQHNLIDDFCFHLKRSVVSEMWFLNTQTPGHLFPTHTTPWGQEYFSGVPYKYPTSAVIKQHGPEPRGGLLPLSWGSTAWGDGG